MTGDSMMTPSSILMYAERGSQLNEPRNMTLRSTMNALVCRFDSTLVALVFFALATPASSRSRYSP